MPAGSNTLGQLGSGDNVSKQAFEKINTINDVFSINAGNTYTMSITKDGNVWGFGDYYHGLSNVRTETNSNSPVKAGNDRFLIRNRDMVINKNGEKVIDIQDASSFNVWVDNNVQGSYTFTSIDESIATVDNTGKVIGKALGTTWVKVKNNNTNEVQIAIIKVTGEESQTGTVVSGGKDFAGILKADGSLYTFGYNSFGELGIGSYIGKDVPTSVDEIKSYIDVQTGDNFTLSLRNDGSVWSFGRNQNGELGLGNRDNKNIPTQITSLSNVIKIAAGRRHSLALDSYGDVYAWGANNLGQLGIKGASSVDVPTKLNLGDVDVIDIACGENLSVIVLSNGKLVVFGEGADSLSYAKVGNAVRAEAGNEIIIITTAGNVTKVGSTLETVYTGKDAVDISAKGNNYMILNKNGEIYNLGANTNGELGFGNNTAANTPTKVERTSRVIEIEAGVNNTYIIEETGLVYASGLNTYGAIGNETNVSTNEYVLVGAQTFKLDPDNLLMTVGDEEEIVNIAVESERFNVLKEDLRDVTDFDWASGEDIIVEVINAATVKAVGEGETKLTVTCKETGKTAEVIVVVIPVDKDRLEKIAVDDVDAKVTGTYTYEDKGEQVTSTKYEVTVETDGDTGNLVISTKDKTDKISIDGGQSFFENGELEYVIQLPEKTNVFEVIVEVANGEQVKYELTVIKQSGNLDLMTLNVNDIAAKSTGSKEYIAICDTDTAVVYAKTANENAKISIDNGEETVNEETQNFDMTDSLIRRVPIKVISESGKELVYTLTIYKESALMDLEKLTVNDIDCTKTSLLEYSVIVPRDLTEVDVYAKALYELAKVNIDNLGEEVQETTKKVKLTGETTTVKIKVSVDGVDREYTLKIQKEPDASALGFVYVNGIEIKPNGNKYEAYVGVTDSSAEVQAIAAVNTSIVQIGTNDAEIGSSTKTVAIDSDKVTYIIRVTDAENPEIVTDYELIIRRPSADNTLKQITVSNESFSEQAKRIDGTNKYVVTISENNKDFKITAETNYDLAKVKIAENSYQARIDTYNVTGFVTPGVYKIAVQAQDGTEAEYELEVKYASSNNKIKTVTVDGYEATKSETEANTYVYTMTNKNLDVSVYALMEDVNAEIAINNIIYEKKEITKKVTLDSKEVKITMNVRAENGDLDTYYLIIKALPDNTNIEEISIGEYKAVAVPYTDNFEIRVPKALTEYEVKVKLEDILAKVGIEDDQANVGVTTKVISKTAGVTKVTIHVTAQDGTEADYKLEIYEMSDNTAISFVKIDGTIIELDSEGKYVAKVASNKESVLADVTAAEARAKVGILSDGISNVLAAEELTLTGGKTEFTITVTAEDGTVKTYPLIIEKMSSNTDILEVYIEGNLITPDENGKYEANIGNLEEANLRVVVEDNASVSINSEPDEKKESTKLVSVIDEVKEVAVVVTAEDGTSKTHTITIRRYSKDASLLEISADGVDSDRITQTGDDSYQMIITQGVTEIDLTGVTTHEKASVKIEDNEYEVKTTTKTVSVPNDENTIKITVKAENGDEKEYTLTVIKKYELAIDSIKVNDILAIDKDGEYVAFIDRDVDTSHVVIKTTDAKAEITIKDVVTGAGTVEFDTATPDEEKRIAFTVTSPVDDDQIECVLVIKKKSNDTSLEYVRTGEKAATEEEDRYVLKVPEGTDTYIIEAKTNSEYAKIRIEDNVDYKEQTDSYNLDLTGLKEKETTVYVTAQDGTTNTYKVVVQKNSNDSTIKTLKIDNNEIIADESHTYKVFVKDGTENVDMYIETTNSGALIKIDAEETETKNILNRTENIGGSAKTYTITVTAEDGSTSRYTLEIGIESSDTGLEWAKVQENKEDADEKTAVEKEEGIYYVTAPSGLTEIKIKARANNQYAKVSINGEEAVIHEGEILYNLPTDKKTAEVTIKVTAQNGIDTAEYKLQIETVSNDTSLAKITVDGELVTEYDEDTKTYDIVVDYEKEEAVVYVETTNEFATVRIAAEDPELHTSTKTVNVPNTENVIDITVIAEDGTSEVRHLNIRKLSRETSVLRMMVNGKNAKKLDDSDTSYQVTIVESDINAVTQIFTGDSRAKVKIGEDIIADPTGEGYSTPIGTNREITLTVTVEAEDPRFTADYTLTINVISDNKDLKSLTVCGITLGENDFDAETNTYTVFAPIGTTSAAISAETVSPYATTRIEENESGNTISYTQTVDAFPEIVILTVTAEDNTSRAYTIVIKEISDDASLLEVKKDGILVNAEEDGNYIIQVPEGTEKIQLFAKTNNEYASISIDGLDSAKETQEKEITLADKETKAVIKVTAQNGTEAEYTVTITKVSSSTELEFIKVEGNEAKLNEETGEYEALILSSVNEANVQVQTVNDFATITIEESSDTKTLSVTQDTTDEVTKVTINVTAENGETKTYILAIRKISGDTSAIIYVEGVAVIPDEDGNYIAKVKDNLTEAEVKVVPNSTYASAEIEGFDPETPQTQHKVTLTGKETTVGVTITAQDDSTDKINLKIVKASDDTSLAELKVGENAVTEYDADTKTYTYYITEDSNLNDIFAKTTNENATVVIGDVKGTGTVTKTNVDTSEDTTNVTITVKSEYGTTVDYTLKIMKESTDASILEIKVNDGEPLTAPYEVTVKSSDVEAKIYAKATNENATVKIGDNVAAKQESTQTIPFPDGANEMTVIVTVTSQDGKDTKEYPVKITKQSSNTAIKEILVNGETVELNDDLEAIVKNVDVSELKVTLVDENAEVGIDDSPLEKGTITKIVQTPVTTVRRITVKAQDGTVKEYEITLIKKFTITGKILDEFVGDEHIAKVTVFQTADLREEDSSINPREVIQEIDTNPDGTYELVLDSGIYDIRISKPGYLNYRVTSIELSGNKGVELEDKKLIAGDVRNSGEINLTDLVSMNDHYGRDVAKYPEYDLNGDGKIDKVDRAFITKNYNKHEIIEKWVNPNPDPEVPEITDGGEEEQAKKVVRAVKQEEKDFILPIACEYVVTSEFGGRTSPTGGHEESHAGIDLRGEHHTEVMAVRDGIVTFAGVQNGYGNCVEIKHEYEGKTIYTFYAHLSELKVTKGHTVSQGDVIGLEGGEPGVDPNPGDTTGHHVHFEIRTASGAKYAVNPRDYMNF